MTFQLLKNITELILGSSAYGYLNNEPLNEFGEENPQGYYENPFLINLPLTNKLLTKLDIEGSIKLMGNLDLSACPYIRHIEAKRTGITSVTLPNGGSLEYLSLPAISTLIIKNQVKLQGLIDNPNKGVKLEHWGNLTNLTIENCPMLDPIEIAITAKDTLQSKTYRIRWFFI